MATDAVEVETKEPLPMPIRMARILCAIDIQKRIDGGEVIEDRGAIWSAGKADYKDSARKLLFRLKRNGLQVTDAD